MIRTLTGRKEWQFFSVLPKADALLAIGWWTVLLLRGVLPAIFAIATGMVVAAVQNTGSVEGGGLTQPLELVGVVFVLLQILTPIQTALSFNLGDRTAAWLYDRLSEACVRPPGMGHLEDPSLTSDLTVARDFDLGMTGPPLSFSMDFIAGGMVEMIGGIAAAALLFGYSWWAPIVLAGAWLSTQYLLRESGVWWDRNTPEVRAAQRDADYTYRLAVDPGPAKELRLFGLAGWTIARFVERRTRLHTLQYEATRLREKPMVWSLLIVLGANVLVFWSMAAAASSGRLSLPELVVFAQAAVGVSLLAFGGFSWALDGASAPVAAVLRLEGAMASPARSHRARRPRPVFRRGRSVSATSRSRTPVRPAGARALRPDDSGRLVDRDRRPERRRQDDAGQAALPPVRPAVGRHRGRRRRPASDRRRRVARADHRGLSGFHSPRTAAARQRRPVGRLGRDRARRARIGRRDRAGEPRHHPRARLHRRHRPVRRAASGSAWRSRARWPPSRSARAWCCSTSRPPSSTCAARPRSSSAFSPRPASARRSSSRTASRPSARPIASASSSTAASSSSGRTTS